jgi:hypothetical protein
MRLIVLLLSVFCLVARHAAADTPNGFRKLSGIQEKPSGVCSVNLKLESPAADHIADADIIEAEFKGDEMQPLVVSIEPLLSGGRSPSGALRRELVTLKDIKQGRTLTLPFTCDASLQGVAAYGIFLCSISKFDTSAQRCADAYAVDMGRRSQDVRIAALSTAIDLPDRLFLLKDGAPELGGSKTFFFGALFRDSSGAFYLPPDFPYQDAADEVKTFLMKNKTDPKLIERIVFKGGELERVVASYPLAPLEGESGLIMRLPHSK